MTSYKTTVGALVISGLLAAFSLSAADQQAQGGKTEKLKPYTLKTCIVSGDKLGEMGDPYVYKYKGREIKFCCKNCLKDFNKEPAKYVKKIEEAEKAAKEGKPASASAPDAHKH